jgi:hypothetical protein
LKVIYVYCKEVHAVEFVEMRCGGMDATMPAM